MEILFHLLTLILSLNVYEIGSQGPSGNVYYCSYCTYMFSQPRLPSCLPYLCWESQLTDQNRLDLWEMFSTHRLKVVNGTCPSCHGQSYSPMYELNYHWALEIWSISRIAKSYCTLPYYPNKERSEEDIVKGSQWRDNYASTYGIKVGWYTFILAYNEYRDAAVSRLREFMQDEKKSKEMFQQFPFVDNKIQYEYGGCPLFGCSILIRDNVTGMTSTGDLAKNDRVAYVICTFGSYNHIDEPSPPRTPDEDHCYEKSQKTSYVTQTKLCTNEWKWEPSKIDMPCQIYYESTQVPLREHLCNESIPPSWRYNAAPRKTDQVIQVHVITRHTTLHDEPINITNLNPATTTTKFTTTLPTPTTTTTTVATTTESEEDNNSDSPLFSSYTSTMVIFLVVCPVLDYFLCW